MSLLRQAVTPKCVITTNKVAFPRRMQISKHRGCADHIGKPAAQEIAQERVVGVLCSTFMKFLRELKQNICIVGPNVHVREKCASSKIRPSACVAYDLHEQVAEFRKWPSITNGI